MYAIFAFSMVSGKDFNAFFRAATWRDIFYVFFFFAIAGAPVTYRWWMNPGALCLTPSLWRLSEWVMRLATLPESSIAAWHLLHILEPHFYQVSHLSYTVKSGSTHSILHLIIWCLGCHLMSVELCTWENSGEKSSEWGGSTWIISGGDTHMETQGVSYYYHHRVISVFSGTETLCQFTLPASASYRLFIWCSCILDIMKPDVSNWVTESLQSTSVALH